MLKINKIKHFFLKYWPQILFVLVVIIGYGQIIFFQTTFKFDAIYNHLPWRQLIVDNLRHGHFPLWNYYHSLGTPIHADPQSGAWYPIVWIISLFGGYDLLVYNLEFVFHVIIAGFGIQYLFRILKYSNEFQFIGSVAYVFSGFFAANSMFFTWIISAAWIPYILASFIVLWRTPNWSNSFITAFFIFMLISGGYPAFTIILVYVVGFLLVWKLINISKTNSKYRNKILIYTSIAVLFSVLLSAVILVSAIQVIPWMPRGEPAALSDAAIPPFLPQHFLSLLLPYPFVLLEYPESIRFDGTNIYLGINSLLVLIYLAFSKKLLKSVMMVLLGSLVFFVAAFGQEYHFYTLLFDYVPGINYFRFPTLFRYFGMLGLLVAIGQIFTKTSIDRYKKPVIILLIIAFSIFVLSLIKSHFIVKPNQYSYYEWVISFGFWEKAFFQSSFQILILLGFLILVYFGNKLRNQMVYFLVLGSFELIVAFNIYMPYTITSFKSNPKESNKVLHSKILDFGLEQNLNIRQNSVKPDSTYLYSYFMFIYKKAVSDKGNTFELTNFRKLKTQKPELYYKLIDNQLFYLANETLLETEMDSIDIEFKELSKSVFLPSNHKKLSSKSRIEQEALSVEQFDYNRITLKLSAPTDRYLVFLQNYYPGWRVKVDQKPQEILKANTSFMSVYIPAGNHIVDFYYEPKLVLWSFWISAITMFIISVYLIIKYRQTHIQN